MQINIIPRAARKELPEQSAIDKELALRDEQLEGKHFATPQEIEKEKLPTEEILSLPMFKVDEFGIIMSFAQTLCRQFGQPEHLDDIRFHCCYLVTSRCLL